MYLEAYHDCDCSNGVYEALSKPISDGRRFQTKHSALVLEDRR